MQMGINALKMKTDVTENDNLKSKITRTMLSCCVSKGTAISEGRPSDKEWESGSDFWSSESNCPVLWGNPLTPACPACSINIHALAASNTKTIPQLYRGLSEWVSVACRNNQILELDTVGSMTLKVCWEQASVTRWYFLSSCSAIHLIELHYGDNLQMWS